MKASGISISVIVPVFNAERYLTICLDSLLDQRLGEDEYEIILVNDGSSDGSYYICDNYRKQHTNICVITQDNQGVSAARNTGMQEARGEWVMFVDADDYVNPVSLRYLLDNFCSDEYDGVRFWTRIREDGKPASDMDIRGEVLFIGTGYGYIKQNGLETFCYTTLYRRSFLEDRGIKFPPYRIGEDFLFASSFLLANPRLCSTSSIVYQYLIHPGSAATSRYKIYARKCTYDHLEVNRKLMEILERDGLRETEPEVYKRSIATIQSKQLLVFSRMLSSDINTKEFRQIVKDQKEQGLLPMKNRNGSRKIWLSRFAVNTLAACPFFYRLVQGLYSRVFVPFILPKLDRNR